MRRIISICLLAYISTILAGTTVSVGNESDAPVSDRFKNVLYIFIFRRGGSPCPPAVRCHCEERSDVAISYKYNEIATLPMVGTQ